MYYLPELKLDFAFIYNRTNYRFKTFMVLEVILRNWIRFLTITMYYYNIKVRYKLIVIKIVS